MVFCWHKKKKKKKKKREGFRHYKTVNHKHNFRSHDAVCMFIIWVATPNCTKNVTRSECCSNFDINFYMTLKVVYSVMVSLKVERH